MDITKEDIQSFDVYGLIKQVKAIKEKNDAVLDATGGRFNIFQILGVKQHETTHSKIIAAFLNPRGTHGIKERFLELFLEESFSEEDLQDFNYDSKNAIVKTESYAPSDGTQGRIDILITSGAKGIIIENKLLAGDQKHQLKRYCEYAGKKLSDFKILYLTKDGHEASLQSGSGIEYKTISYKKEILNWLENCCAESARFPLVRETLVQYANLIRNYTGESMSAKATNEIINVIANDENIEFARLIVNNYRNAKIKIANALLGEFGEVEKLLRKYFELNFKRTEKGKIGNKDFILRYEIDGIEDVRLAFSFGDSVTEKEELKCLKINLEFKDGKNTSDEEKSSSIEKYRVLLADISNPTGETEFSAWRTKFEIWETKRNEILTCVERILENVKNL